MPDPTPALDALTVDHFKPLLQKTCQLHVEAGSEGLALVVEEAAEIPTAQRVEAGKRRSFSVTFRGPREPALEQGIYAVEHPDLGRQELFLVPVNETDAGRFYEAVFT